jgi:rhodanese-related sulfurtransferase
MLLVLALCTPGCSGSKPAATLHAARAGSLGPAAARELLRQHPEALLLDVRNPDEWNDDLGHIEGARLLPLPELESRIGELAAWKDKPVVTVCRVGARSRTAAEEMAAAGFQNVSNLAGGMAAWRQAGF